MKKLLFSILGISLIAGCGAGQGTSTSSSGIDKSKPDWIEIKTTINGNPNFCLTFKDGTFLTWQQACGHDDSIWSYAYALGDQLQFYQTDSSSLTFLNAHKTFESKEDFYQVSGRTRDEPDFSQPDWSIFFLHPRSSGGVGLVAKIKNEAQPTYVCIGDKNYKYATATVDLFGGLEVHAPVVKSFSDGTLDGTLPDECAAIRFNGKNGEVDLAL